MRANEVYLIDSGAQYPDGTTDITRTVWTGPDAPPAELRERVTRVLKGHIAIATLVFPQGVGGAHLDAFARRALWAAGLDYDHGTGHGVGSYLSVHEGPVSLSRLARPVPIAAGMILSNEPGFYLPGPLWHPAGEPAAGAAGRAAGRGQAVPALRDADPGAVRHNADRAGDAGCGGTRTWLDAYHARVLAEVGPKLDAEAGKWLAAACKPLR